MDVLLPPWGFVRLGWDFYFSFLMVLLVLVFFLLPLFLESVVLFHVLLLSTLTLSLPRIVVNLVIVLLCFVLFPRHLLDDVIHFLLHFRFRLLQVVVCELRSWGWRRRVEAYNCINCYF